MKYLKYVMTGALVLSSVFAERLPENQSWNNFQFAPKLAADAPAYSLINIGNFGYWQKYDATSAHTPGGDSGGIYPRGTAANVFLDGVLIGGSDRPIAKLDELDVSSNSVFKGAVAIIMIQLVMLLQLVH